MSISFSLSKIGFENDKYKFIVVQKTSKFDSLFNVKNNVKHFTFAICEVKFSFGSNYVDEINGMDSNVNTQIKCLKYPNIYFSTGTKNLQLSCREKIRKQIIFKVHLIKLIRPSPNYFLLEMVGHGCFDELHVFISYFGQRLL